MLNIVSARAPERMEKPQWNVSTNVSMPNRPTTMEGRLDRVSIAVLATLVTGPCGAYWVRKIAAPSEMGIEMSSVRMSR